MPRLNLTFGVELEFLCVYPPGCFATCVPEPDRLGNYEAGPAIYHALLKASIPATGYESLDDDFHFDGVSHTRWRVETDSLILSALENEAKPLNYDVANIELSSRKFDFFKDDWRSEIRAVLDVLASLEANTKGCRFITNESTGLHVHVGNDTQKVPLRTVKNLFQLVTAFERCFDLLHTAPRIQHPDDYYCSFLYAPPSFFHTDRYAKNDSAMLLDWLAGIEEKTTYEGLASLFLIRNNQELIADCGDSHGHNSAYNFDNLFADENADRYENTITKTIEFRQHAGTLDFQEIVAWVLLTTQMVQYCHDASDVELIALIAHGIDLDIGLRDILSAIGCHAELIAHYLNEDDAIAGTLSGSKSGSPKDVERFIALLEQNDDEQSWRSNEATLKAVMDEKNYGFDGSANVIEIPVEAIARYYQDACIYEAAYHPWHSTEERASNAKQSVLKLLAALYKGSYDEEIHATMAASGPVVNISRILDLIEGGATGNTDMED